MAKKNVIKSISIFLFFGIISCKSNSHYRNLNNLKLEVLSIDLIGKVYIVKAKDETRLYKIVSAKMDNYSSFCNQIEKEGSYNFVLKNVIGNFELPAHVDAVEFNGQDITLEKDTKNEVFQSENLKGLCIVK
jgi:hypothetical protein